MKTFRNPYFLTIALLSFYSVGNATSPVAASPVQQNSQQSGQSTRQQAQQEVDRLGGKRPAADDVPLPDCLRNLTLTSAQQVKIKEVVGKANEEMAATWQQFSQSFMASVQTEVLLAAAIEDHLTDSQRKQVRDLRRRSMQQHRVIFERSLNGQRPAGTADPSQDRQIPNGSRQSDQPQSNQDPLRQDKEIVQEDLTVFGVALTNEQIAAADQMQERYMSDLRTQNREIAALHLHLVCLEAQKMEEIELLLTPDQLQQLRDHRQNGRGTLSNQRER